MIDLKQLADDRGFRTSLDPTSTIDRSRESRPWFIRIPCRFGWIGVHSASLLSAYYPHRRLWPKLLAIPGATIRQRGDRELTIVFPADRFDDVSVILKAKHRLTLSSEERTRRADRMKSLRKTALPGSPLRSPALAR
jgi:hypothetical protein